jgi:hypothetical protein
MIRFTLLFVLILGTITLTVNTVSSQTQPDPIADYTFDEDASDATGNYNGTLEGDAAIVDDPDRGGVLELTETGYVTVPVDITNELDNFSFTAWVKYGGTIQWAGLMGIGMLTANKAPYWDFHIQAEQRILSYYGSLLAVWPGDGTAQTVTEFTMPEEWTHIAFTFQLTVGGAVYVNSELQTQEDWNSSNDHDVSPKMLGAEIVTIGRDAFNQGTLTNTRIDDFRFFNKTIDEDEVFAIYENVLPSSVEKDVINDLYNVRIYPNPVRAQANIRFHIPENRHVKLGICNIHGQEIAVIADDFRNAGTHTIAFDGSDFESGVYFIRLESDGHCTTKRMTILK